MQATKGKAMGTPLLMYISVLLFGVHVVVGESPIQGECYEMHDPICSTMPYNRAFLPNKLEHTIMSDAELQIQTFTPLLQYGCSDALRPFLCAAYFPQCSARGGRVDPCKALCTKARDECLPILQEFGYPWPESLNCDSFPVDYRCFNNIQ